MLESGEKQVGWKVGFGSPSGLALLELDAPVIGFIVDSGGADIARPLPVSGWTAPVVECEIAALVARDIPAGVDPADVGRYVESWAPAFEFADIDSPPRDVAEVLSGNIFHRAYAIGEHRAEALADVAQWEAEVDVDGECQHIADPAALTGDVSEVIARTAALAPMLGRCVLAGDVILTGSIVAPIPVRSGATVAYRLSDLPEMTVSIA